MDHLRAGQKVKFPRVCRAFLGPSTGVFWQELDGMTHIWHLQVSALSRVYPWARGEAPTLGETLQRAACCVESLTSIFQVISAKT